MEDEIKVLKEASKSKYENEDNIVNRLVRAKENLGLKYGYTKATELLMKHLGVYDMIGVINYDKEHSPSQVGELLATVAGKG